MSVKERLKEYIKYKKLSDRAFCIKVGLSPTYVSSMKVSIQPDKVNMIAVHFPDLNTGWLLTGEGEMLKMKEQELKPYPIHNGEDAKTIDYLMEENIEYRKTIGHQAESILRMQEQIAELYKKLDKK